MSLSLPNGHGALDADMPGELVDLPVFHVRDEVALVLINTKAQGAGDAAEATSGGRTNVMNVIVRREGANAEELTLEENSLPLLVVRTPNWLMSGMLCRVEAQEKGLDCGYIPFLKEQ